MKNVPFDVVLLRLGLKYAQLRATKNTVEHLFEKPCDVMNHDLIYQNLTVLHAKVHYFILKIQNRFCI